MSVRILKTNSIYLQRGMELRRRPPRKPEDMQDSYLDLFDFDLLFGDVFQVEEHIVAIGPPLLNLEDAVAQAVWYIDGVQVPPRTIQLDRLDRVSRTIIPLASLNLAGSKAEELWIEIGGRRLVCRIGSDQTAFFRGRNVLVTLSRENEPHIIKKWLEVNAKQNQIDAVVFADNRSQRYSKEELRALIESVDGIEIGLVFDWEHAYGVTGGPSQVWDSDFGQYQVWEIARQRFLAEAKSVTISDVDEIPLTESGRPLWEVAESTKDGVFCYPMRSVVPRTHKDIAPNEKRSFGHFNYFQTNSKGSNKYTYVPMKLPEGAQLKVHYVAGAENVDAEPAFARHFIGLHQNWRNKSFDYDVAHPASGLATGLEVDSRLLQALSNSEESTH